MAGRAGTIERAYQLAGSGGFKTAKEIQSQLCREGYFDAASQISGGVLRRELGQLCRGAIQQRLLTSDPIHLDE